MNAQVGRGRLKLALIALIFLGPLAVAAWLYYSDAAPRPAGRTNAGYLIDPVTSIDAALGDTTLRTLVGEAADGKWLLVYRHAGACGDDCEQALYRMRQSRLMLGRDMTRLVRVFLHGQIEPDRVLLETQHEGLLTARSDRLDALLSRLRPADSTAGGLFLIDPLGNLVMYFPPELGPDEMVDDIEHLLELSRIG